MLDGLARLVDARSRRVSSYDRSGGNADSVAVAPGETAVLADLRGAGVIKHLWITLNCADPLARRNLVLRMFWDGQEHPSVLSPLGDFFGQGWGMKYPFSSLPLVAAPAGSNALVGYFPMPFGDGARIEIVNESAEPVTHLYYYVDYDELPRPPEDEGRFHASYRQTFTAPEDGVDDRENDWEIFREYAKNPSDARNHLWVEAEGRGHFVGVHHYVNCPTPVWYGEGDDMFLLDGEPWPGSLHGTGTEDYFNQAWCPDEVFQHPFFGTARAPGRGGDTGPRFGWLGRTHCYRFHLTDPVRFSRSLRASIEHGHANALTLEIASVAFWYQTLPSKPLPDLPPPAERVPLPEISVVDVHRWRDAWRASRGGGRLWGNER